MSIFTERLCAERGHSVSSSKPWLSLVVPAYNAECFLEECVSSFRLAANPDVEVIVVDDGSTDGTPGVCDRLASESANVKVIHRDNGGSPSARNAGCLRAEGDWIWFIDSDDVIAPYALDVLRGRALTTECDAVQIQFLRFSDGEKPAWPASMPSENPVVLSSEEYLRKIYRGRGQHYMWSFLLRADALLGRNDHAAPERSRNEHAGWPFREEFSLYEDVVSMEEILRRIDGVEVLRGQYYGYRQSAGSMTQKPSNKAADSGLRAVLDLSAHDDAGDPKGKMCLEISLLFNAYKLIEWSGADSESLRKRYRAEISSRAREVGVSRLGLDRFGRLVLMRTGLLDYIFKRRYCR